MSDLDLPIRVAALYKFTPLEDCASLRSSLEQLCVDEGIKGTLLLAHEGINGTIAGTDAAIDRVLEHVRTLPGCADIEVKDSRAASMPFLRMKVRIKREIVTMGKPDVDPLSGTGHYVAPSDWNALIDDPDTIVIDTRNDYEVAVGTFAGAIDPRTRSFRDFPAWFEANRAALDGNGQTARPKIAMFCTGGIRCEKSTAFLKSQGLDQVYHLKGGILAYLETVPAEASRWQGDCFVFDERVTVGHGLRPGGFVLCRACRMPVSPQQRASPLYREGVSCPACQHERSDAQRARYAERERQVRLAEARGIAHVGAILPEAEDG
ncbi:rhodanese-related sulfurtransferase [Sphingosinicella sp. BN140058]|uniref:oxygen-dependent tRNA uridine(34) hydroxylase TrhO n=1 Tax=Sphingosinicella sp. BN140058 TaxID=1892855 RepID=UPI0010134EB7|nr:rhodanese-related sulfurtransferase [Sphingosinicella sp. BN140058]QAY78778.1 rhodanese-related sulfurtransferase [Sphingosinicella sp. BN140058]